ncbi:MAG: DUF1844 domain-containing protein [Candidatus Omnitrophota bacterium]
MEENIKKSVDESWKETAAREKGTAKKEGGKKEPEFPEANFSFFVSTLALQASVFLGHIPNPATDKKEKNLPQAKFIIDTLGVIKDKTRNNLTAEEDSLLENMLYELRMHYVNADKEDQSD